MDLERGPAYLVLKNKNPQNTMAEEKKNACCPTPTKHLHINFLLTTKVRVSSKVPMSTAVENAASATSKLVLQEALLRTEKDKF